MYRGRKLNSGHEDIEERFSILITIMRSFFLSRVGPSYFLDKIAVSVGVDKIPEYLTPLSVAFRSPRTFSRFREGETRVLTFRECEEIR